MPRNASPNSTVSADRVFGAEFSNPSRSQPSRRPQGLDFDELMELTNSSSSPSEPLSTPANSFISTKEALPRADVVVAGALAVDFSCDYAPFTTATSQTDPLPHTSNPAVITQTLGGVAHNIAKAVHLLGTPVRLHSAVGDDLSGRAALAQLREEGMSVSGIETLPAPSRTAQYVAVNNANKDLTLAMADMSILETIPKDTVSELASSLFLEKPLFPRDEAIQEVFVADANWSSEALHNLLGAVCYPATTATTIFEPVSTAKALRIFPPKHFPSIARSVFPQRLADIITPNNHELIALHDFALSSSYFELLEWFKVIDALGIPSSGLRVPLAVAVGSELVDEGIPQMAIKLLPFLPTILTKLGSRGVLMVKLLRAGAPELQDDSERQYVLARNMSADSNSAPSGDVDVRRQVGGLYVRLFPVDKVLRAEEVVSVNGIGDTFCGALASGLSKGRRVQDVVAFAQRAAGLSLQSRESVSPALRGLQWS
jgi:pseudouridine-5'-phosphate glycosidase/pseudouridine kinase